MRQYFHMTPRFYVFANTLGRPQYFMILLDFVAANIFSIYYAFEYAQIFLAQLF
jgi:hypothetical protein